MRRKSKNKDGGKSNYYKPKREKHPTELFCELLAKKDSEERREIILRLLDVNELEYELDIEEEQPEPEPEPQKKQKAGRGSISEANRFYYEEFEDDVNPVGDTMTDPFGFLDDADPEMRALIARYGLEDMIGDEDTIVTGKAEPADKGKTSTGLPGFSYFEHGYWQGGKGYRWRREPAENIVLFRDKINEKLPTYMLIAHYDIVNDKSDNVQDNTASVYHAFNIAKRLESYFSEAKRDRNIVVVFTDQEESGGGGADLLSDRINEGAYGNVLGVFNMELTAGGQHIWVEDDMAGEPFSDEVVRLAEEFYGDIFMVSTPFNDSFVLRRNKIPSLCFGIVPTLSNVSSHNLPDFSCWKVCHSLSDTIYSHLVPDDMVMFNDFMFYALMNIQLT